MSRMMRWLVVAVVGVFVIAALASAVVRPAPASPEETTREISQSLRCPTCAGESIADSAALLSNAMRETVHEQVQQGRSPGQIRAWFAERYGDEVLLEPPRRGYGWLLWTLPLVLVGATVAVLARRRHTRRRWLGPVLAVLTVAATVGVWAVTSEDGPSGTPARYASDGGERDQGASADTVAVLREAVAESPGDTQRRLALAAALERAGDTEETVEAYAAAVRLQPLEADLRYRYAFALVRSGDVDTAADVLDETLTLDGEHAPTLLLLGALLEEDEPERSAELLERFVELEPDHPAAGQISELLDGRTPGPGQAP